MTVAKRLTLLLAVPLVALLGLGIFSRFQLSQIEGTSRFVADISAMGFWHSNRGAHALQPSCS